MLFENYNQDVCAIKLKTTFIMAKENWILFGIMLGAVVLGNFVNDLFVGLTHKAGEAIHGQPANG
ncbi:MAG: hypothetical protein KGJ07_03680 [Patescibacteria group bacterium]|nr:hypothetical protein [Patescibacteria group bacterium]